VHVAKADELNGSAVEETSAQVLASETATQSKAQVIISGRQDQSVTAVTSANAEDRLIGGQAQGSIPAPGFFIRTESTPPSPSLPGQPNRVGPQMETLADANPVTHRHEEGVAAESLATLSSDHEIQAGPVLLGTILPVDFSGLEASVRDFFEQLDQLGLTLTAGQVDVLFSAGVVSVAAAVALEIARRQRQPVVQPVLVRGRGRLPYSSVHP
jgi:hypothetical protein